MSKSLKDYLEDDPGLCRLIGREELERMEVEEINLPDKNRALNIENAEEAAFCLEKGINSKSVDVLAVARGALLYYIEKEKIWQTNKIEDKKGLEQIMSLL